MTEKAERSEFEILHNELNPWQVLAKTRHDPAAADWLFSFPIWIY
jgi:hypothetical protein